MGPKAEIAVVQPFGDVALVAACGRAHIGKQASLDNVSKYVAMCAPVVVRAPVAPKVLRSCDMEYMRCYT